MFFGRDFGFDGMPGSHRSNAKVDNEKYYKILGVEKTASKSEIKRAYYTLAKTHHPDRGGDENKFKEILLAFEVLHDEEKRKIYDKFGEEGIKNEMGGGGGGGMHGVDLFDLFNGSSRRRGPKKGKNSVFDLQVTLEEIYNGAVKKLKLTKDVICSSCKGTGSKSGKTTVCSGCNGKGMKTRYQRIASSMVQQISAPCDECNATGQQINKKDICPTCKGEKIKEMEKILQVKVEKGVLPGSNVVFPGEADERPGILPGDVICVIKEKPHATFRREGMNLFIKKCVTLSEALCGIKFAVKHLDSRIISMETFGTVISPRQVRSVQGEGMPHHKNNFIKGVLFVEFEVNFPEDNSISKEDLLKIQKLLNQPSAPFPYDDSTCTNVELIKKSVEEVKAEQQSYSTDKEPDSDSENEGMQTTCHTQ